MRREHLVAGVKGLVVLHELARVPSGVEHHACGNCGAIRAGHAAGAGAVLHALHPALLKHHACAAGKVRGWHHCAHVTPLNPSQRKDDMPVERRYWSCATMFGRKKQTAQLYVQYPYYKPIDLGGPPLSVRS